MKSSNRTISKILLLLLSFVQLSCYADGKDKLYNILNKELHITELYITDSFRSNLHDTINNKSIVFVVPRANKLAGIVVEIDKLNSLKDEKYIGANITYNITQLSTGFISLIKSVYIEDSTSPKGFFAWEECLTYLSYKNLIYKIEYNISDSTLNRRLSSEVDKGELDLSCLEVGTNEHIEVYFQSSILYIHNPLSSPFCNIDIPITLSEENISFTLINMQFITNE